MTYLIEGSLFTEDMPEKYMNKFALAYDYESGMGGKHVREHMRLAADNVATAVVLRRKGFDLRWVDDLETAKKYCMKSEMKIADTKIMRPREGWQRYLSSKYGDLKEARVLNGDLNVWNELRIPTPWAYVAKKGELEASFSYHDGKFEEPGRLSWGESFGYGIFLPIFSVHRVRTQYKTND
jgi:hypothetical protein